MCRRRRRSAAGPSIAQGQHTLIAAPTGSGKTLAAFLIAIDAARPREPRRPAAGRSARALRLAAQGAEHRHPQEPRGTAQRDCRRRGRAGPAAAAHHRRRPHRRHHRGRTRGDGEDAAAHPGDDARVALPAPDLGAQPPHAGHGAHGRSSTKSTPSSAAAVARTSRCRSSVCSVWPAGRCSGSACRPRRSRSRTWRKWLVGTGGAACTIVNEGHGRPMDLDIELPRSELDAVMAHEVWGEYYDRLAELAQAHRTTLVFVNTRKLAERITRHLERTAGRRPGGDASRQPVEGVASRRRNAAQGRAAARAGRDRVARARHRHRIGRSGVPDRVAAHDRRAHPARGPLGPPGRRAAEGARVPGDARRPPGVPRARAGGEARRARRHRAARRAARRAHAAARRRNERRRRGDRRRRALRDGTPRVAVPRAAARRLRRRRRHGRRGLLHAQGAACRAAAPRRSARARCAAGAARACSRRCPAAPFPKWPTTASSSTPATPSSARSTRTSPSRATPATSFSSATPRGRSCR